MSYEIVESCELEMEEKVEFLRNELNTVRTGMANANMVNGIDVDYYGSATPLMQIASISVQEGRTIVIKPYDPSSLKDIEHALNLADLGIAPQNDGKVVRLTVPMLTGEVRKEMVKKVKAMSEAAKVQVRNVRRDAMNDIKKDEETSEDIRKRQEEEVQKVTDKYVKLIDELASAKEAEVLKV